MVLRFAGELDLAAVQEAGDAVARARGEASTPVRLDLSELTFIDSTGLHLVMRLHSACRADGCPLEIVPGPRAVQRVFAIAGVLETLPFTPGAR